jgi:peptide/nickel transport system permease protein
LGLVILALLVLVAALAPLVAPYDPSKMTSGTETLGPPSAQHWMGTDDLGRDVFSRILFGAKISLTIGLIAVGISLLAGTAIGLFAGYYGGRRDWIIMRFIDILMSMPGVLLALVVIAILGVGITNVMVALGVANIPIFVRIVRGSVLSVREEPYVESAKAAGSRDGRVLLRYLLPNIIGPLLVVSTLLVADALLMASGLSFLGLGAQPPSPEWGAMLSAGRQYIRQAWWTTVFPGGAIATAVLAINLVGDGMRDAFDPKAER